MPNTSPTSFVLDRARSRPEERRHGAERLFAAMEHAGTQVYRLSEEERHLVEEGLAGSLRGDLVPDDEMEALFTACEMRVAYTRAVRPRICACRAFRGRG